MSSGPQTMMNPQLCTVILKQLWWAIFKWERFYMLYIIKCYLIKIYMHFTYTCIYNYSCYFKVGLNKNAYMYYLDDPSIVCLIPIQQMFQPWVNYSVQLRYNHISFLTEMFALLVSYSVTATRDTDLVKVKKVCT